MTENSPEEVEKSEQQNEDVEGHKMGRMRSPEEASKSTDDGDDVEGHKMGRK